MKSNVPHFVVDMYQEFKFTEHFSLSMSYEDMPAHKVDWWMRFMQMDDEVQAELSKKK